MNNDILSLKKHILFYLFSIGNMAAYDMDDPNAVVSPGGVGFDINCGVRLLRTNLTYKDIEPVKVCNGLVLEFLY